MDVTYTSNKYKTVTFPPKVSTNLYDLAQEYKKKNLEFDKEIVMGEKIERNKIIPSGNVVKDIFSSTGKFFTKKFLLYENTTIKFKDLNPFVKKFNGKDYYIFDNKNTAIFLNSLYSKLGLNLEAKSDLFGKKINLYFPKDINTSWFIKKYISIESSSAPIEISELKPYVKGDVTNYKAYSIALNQNEGAQIEAEVNGAIIKVKKVNNDAVTWVKSTHGKDITENDKTKRTGWGKVLIDLPLYNNNLIDVYYGSVENVNGESIVEVAFPIYVTIEDMLTNKSLFDKYNTILFDSVNFFNAAYISVLKGLPTDQKTGILKKLIDLLPSETKELNKRLGASSRAMNLYLGLKKAFIGILRRIRILFDAFSIKDLNNLLNAINIFNNKRNFIIKKRKNSAPEKIYIDFLSIGEFVIEKNLNLIKGEIQSNNIKWGINKTFNLKNVDEIKNAVSDLASFYSLYKYLDPLNLYSIVSAEAIVAEVKIDFAEERKKVVNDAILDLNSMAFQGSKDYLSTMHKKYKYSGESFESFTVKKYKNFVESFIKNLTYAVEKFLVAYHTKLGAVDTNIPSTKEITRYISDIVGLYMFENDYLVVAKNITYSILKDSNINKTIPYDEEIFGIAVGNVPHEDMLDDVNNRLINTTALKNDLVDIRRDYIEMFLFFITCYSKLEKWYNKTNNLEMFASSDSNVTLVDLLRNIQNASGIKFKQDFFDRVTKLDSSRGFMDINFNTLKNIGQFVLHDFYSDGITGFIDIEPIKAKKLEENVENDGEIIDRNIVPVSNIIIEEFPDNVIRGNMDVSDYAKLNEIEDINMIRNEESGYQDNNNLNSVDISEAPSKTSASTYLSNFKKEINELKNRRDFSQKRGRRFEAREEIANKAKKYVDKNINTRTTRSMVRK